MRRFVPFAKKSQGRNMVRKFRGDTSSTKVQWRPNGEAAKQFSTNTARIEEFSENLYAAYKVLVTSARQPVTMWRYGLPVPYAACTL